MIAAAAIALALPAARAHSPHDAVAALAVTAEGDALALLDLEVGRALYAGEPGARTWAPRACNAFGDDVRGLVVVDDGRVVLWSSTTAWALDVDTWIPTWLGDAVTSAGGGAALWSGGPGGLYRDGVLVSEAPIATIDGDVAVAEDGTVYVEGEAVPGAVAAYAARVGGVLYVVDPEGVLSRIEGDEAVPCGQVPAPGTRPAVARLGGDAATLLAATGSRGPFASDDLCDSWTDRSIPVEVEYEDAGGAASTAEAFAHLSAGDPWIAAGWAGLFQSDDEGVTWAEVPLVPPDYTRGLAFGGADLVFVGSAAGGVLRTRDGGATFDAPNHGLEEPAIQSLSLGPHGLFAIAGHRAWRSTDEAETWAELDPGLDLPVSIHDLDGATFAFGGPSGGEGTGNLARWSTDGGDSWAAVDGLDDALLGSVPVRAATLGGAPCVFAIDPVAVACRVLGAWTRAYAGAGADLAGPAAADDTLLFVEGAGVVRMYGPGDVGTPVPAFGHDRPLALAADEDGGLLFVGARGIAWSGDGRGWRKTGETLDAPVHVLAARPGHPGTFLAGTHDGVFLLGTGTAERWGAVQRIDDRSPFLACDACEGRYGTAVAGMDTLTPLGGGTASAWVRGSTIRVRGDGTPSLSVDGVAISPGGCGEIAAEATGLDDAWHEVAVTGDARVDAIEGVSPSPPPGCAGLGFPGALLGLTWSRRRRR